MYKRTNPRDSEMLSLGKYTGSSWEIRAAGAILDGLGDVEPFATYAALADRSLLPECDYNERLWRPFCEALRMNIINQKRYPLAAGCARFGVPYQEKIALRLKRRWIRVFLACAGLVGPWQVEP